jgi:hypothetical protein
MVVRVSPAVARMGRTPVARRTAHLDTRVGLAPAPAQDTAAVPGRAGAVVVPAYLGPASRTDPMAALSMGTRPSGVFGVTPYPSHLAA